MKIGIKLVLFAYSLRDFSSSLLIIKITYDKILIRKEDACMKKLMCLLLIVSLLIPVFLLEAYAGDNSFIPISNLITEYECVSNTTTFNFSETAPKYYYNYGESDTPNIVYTAYSLLDSCQKQIYNTIINAPVGTTSFTLEFDDGVFLLEDYQSGTYLSTVMYAILRDHPEIFYFHGYSIAGGYVYNNGEYIAILYYEI